MLWGDWLTAGGLLLALAARRRSPHRAAELVLSLCFGALWEWLFFDFWTYDPARFGVFVAPRLPAGIVATWGTLLTGGLALSDRLAALAVRGRGEGPSPRLVAACDALAVTVLGCVMETLGLRLGLWRYEPGLARAALPGVGISAFAALGFVAIGILVPTSLRFWRQQLRAPFPGRVSSAP